MLETLTVLLTIMWSLAGKRAVIFSVVLLTHPGISNFKSVHFRYQTVIANCAVLLKSEDRRVMVLMKSNDWEYTDQTELKPSEI